ncbi:hypothetical protein [Aeromicrobium sp. 179-A 4D2 NHS]|uniref:DUF7226 domain-containing protein n=1 Tax=Aeromicrobium sp. 179-A 4D2 NHS TaxID=3142375 RepID=UPI0039A1CE2E
MGATQTIVRKGQTGEATTNPGQFGSVKRSETYGIAAGDPIRDIVLGWEPNDGFPLPQANDLEKVIVVVDAVAAGADTNEASADVLGVGERNGHYYMSAAGYLGLVDKNVDEFGVDTYSLTEVGQFMAEQTPADRSRMIGAMVDRMDDVQYLREHGDDALVGEYELHEELSENTATRRAACIRSWSQQAMDSAVIEFAYGNQTSDLAQRCERGSARAQAQREEARRIAAAQTVKVGAVCPRCFMTMPLTGICDDCD